MGRVSRIVCACLGVAALVGVLAYAAVQHKSATTDVDTQEMVTSAISSAGIDAADVAAVVSGRVVTQEQVDAEVAAERVRSGLGDDSAWEAYLASSGSSEWDMRARVIKQIVDEVLIELQADELGIDVDYQVEARVDDVEALYPSHASFIAALSSKGYTEQTYRDAVRASLLHDAVQEAVIETPQPSDEQIRQYVVVVAPLLVGRRSSEILVSLDDLPLAQRIEDELAAGADFAELAREHSIDSTAASGGDAGWDSLNTFLGVYQRALSSLEVGEVSGIVRSRFGYYIIKCTDKYDAPTDADGNVDLDAIPDDLMAWIVDAMAQNMSDQMFDIYIGNLEATAPIAVFDRDGDQVTSEQCGLATEVVDLSQSSEDVIEGVQDRVREAAESGVASIRQLTQPSSPDVDIAPDGAAPAAASETASSSDSAPSSGDGAEEAAS